MEAEENFYAVRKAQRKDERAKKRRKKAFDEAKLADPSMINDDDDRWLDLFYTTDMGSDDSE
jgi:hypothetical protein